MESVSSFLIDVLNAVYQTVMGNYHPETYHLPLSVLYPIDRSSYFGFILTLLAMISISIAYGGTMTTITSYIASSYSMLYACFELFRDKIAAIDEFIESQNNSLKELDAKLNDLIEFHIKIIEYYNNIVVGVV